MNPAAQVAPAAPAALLVACTYERSPFHPLHWAAADVVAIARALVRHCGFKRVIVLHRRPSPFFTEGETGNRESILNFARQLVPVDGDCPPELAFEIGLHIRRPTGPRKREQPDEFLELCRCRHSDPTPEQFDSLESLVVALLNRWLDAHPEGGPLPDPGTLQTRRERIHSVFPELTTPTPSEPGIEFRGIPTDAAIRNALIELDTDPVTREPTPFLLTVLSGHGVQLRGRNCFVLPDSHNRFLDLTTLPIESLIRWSGSQAVFIDACQIPFDATTFARTGQQGLQTPGVGTRDLGGNRIEPKDPTGWILGAPVAPLKGSVALLHTCWPGKPAAELQLWRQGIGTRCFLEAVRSSAWRSEPDADSSAGSSWNLSFEEIARQVYREVRQSSWSQARLRADARLVQDPYIHRAGIPEDLILARKSGPPSTRHQDPRLWVHPARLDDIHASRPLRTSLGIPFVHLQHCHALIACWPVRNRDFERFRVATPGSKAPPMESMDQADLPRTRVTHDEALAFCAWLTREEIDSGFLPPTGFRYDLPTDGEWDYCAGIYPPDRSPIQIQLTPIRPWAEEVRPAGFCYEAQGPIPVMEAAPLGEHQIQANPGLLGLGGNVWEMTKTPFRPDADSTISVRGQSYRTSVAAADLTIREERYVDLPSADVGFRVVLRVEA